MINLPSVDIGNCNSFIVISDVHLCRPSDEATQFFFQKLENIPHKTTIVFLGDIFDFIYGDSKFFLKYWGQFFAICKKLKERGFKLIFIEGNHDFGFHSESRTQPFFDVSGDIEVCLNHPILGNVALRHGDDVICKPSYIPFRKQIKSNLVREVVGRFPHRVLNWACLKWADHSRSKHSYDVSKEFIDSCVTSMSLESPRHNQINTFIFGHIHIDADFKMSSGQKFISGPEWLVAPSFLIADATGVRREYLGAEKPVQVVRDETV